MKTYKGITARGESIQVSFTWNGKRYRETLRWSPTSPNLREANRLRESVLYEIDRGTFDHKMYLSKFPNSSKARTMASTQADFLTIDQALWAWLDIHREHLQLSTIRDYTSSIKHHLSSRFGFMVVRDLTPQDVKSWLAELQISNKRKNNIVIPLRRCFEELFLDEVIESNPMIRVPNLSVDSSEPKPFTEHEIQLILAQLNTDAKQPYKHLIQIAFSTGLRTSELIALRWSDVDIPNKRIHVQRAKVRGVLKPPKTSSGKRFVDLSPMALEALELQSKYKTIDFAEVFFDIRNNLPIKDDQLIRKTIWKPALQAAGIPYRSPYQTRHTYASQMLSKGINPLYVANQMGHSDWGMIRKVYGRWITQESGQ